MTLMEPITATEAGVIRCRAGDLRNAVAAVAPVIERHNTIPVLGCLLIAPIKGDLFISGTDMDSWMTVRCPAQAGKIKPFCVPLQTLRRLLAWAPAEDEVTIRLEKDELQIKVGQVNARQRALIPAADWPAAPEVSTVSSTLPETALAQLIDSVRFAISTEETRYYLNGIFLTAIDGKLAGVATDGHRLARYCSSEDWPWPSVIFPRKTVGLLRSGLRPGGNRTVSVAVDADVPRMRIAGDDWSMICRTVDGTFPDYGRVIPRRAENPGYAVLSLDTMRRFPEPIGSAGHCVKLDLLGALASSRDVLNDLDVDMPIEAHGDFALGFNGKYLRLLARTFGTIRIEATGPNDPAHILTEDPDLTVVLMPMRV